MSRSWQRPYQPGQGRLYVIVWEALALALFYWTTVRLFSLGSPARAGLAGLVVLAWLAAAWRIRVIGVYVGPQAVRIRGMFSTRTLTWPQIDQVVVEPAGGTVPWLRKPADRMVTLHLADARRVGTTLFANGIDFHARPGEFQRVAAHLRHCHAATRARASAAVN